VGRGREGRDRRQGRVRQDHGRRDRCANAREIVLAADAVRDHDDRTDPALRRERDRTLGDLDRLRCGLDDHEDRVDRRLGHARQGPHPGLEVGDHDRVSALELPEQLLR